MLIKEINKKEKINFIKSKPFIKWAGGKQKLIENLINLMPLEYDNYFEPFVGGGALFFRVKPNSAYLLDYNDELINLYQVVKNNTHQLIEDLRKHKNNKEYYYKIRNLDRNKNYSKLSKIEKASRFIYLNKTCYNGLYRVNSKGEFNVPFGNYKNPKIVDEETLMACAKTLKNANLICGDFEIIKNYVKENDFVYFDPPYMPINSTSSFTNYTNNGFDKEEQKRLKRFFDYLTDKNVYCMLSNSYTDFIINLYHAYRIHIVKAPRAINCKSEGRGKIKEVVITNY